MGTLSIDKLKRLVGRAKVICEDSDNDEIDVGGEELVAKLDAFDASDQAVVELTRVETKEGDESDTALARLAAKYDAVRSATLIKVPGLDVKGRSSSFTTPDDLLGGAEDLEDDLARIAGVDKNHPVDGTGEAAPTGKAWARKLLAGLLPVLTDAVKEYRDAVKASANLQKAQKARGTAKSELEQTFYAFRRLVRDIFGPDSREYHSLRTRTRTESDEEEETGGEPEQPAATDTPEPEQPAETDTPEPVS